MTITVLTEEVLRPLVDQHLSSYEIADRLGYTQNRIYRALTRLGIKTTARRGQKPGTKLKISDVDGYVSGSLSKEAKPHGYDAAERRQWDQIGEWPTGIRFQDANVPRERFLGGVGRGDTGSGCSSSAAMASDGVMKDAGHRVSPKGDYSKTSPAWGRT